MVSAQGDLFGGGPPPAPPAPPGRPHKLRKTCSCGETEGLITRKSGQDVVRCRSCDSYLYCAPRSETEGGAL